MKKSIIVAALAAILLSFSSCSIVNELKSEFSEDKTIPEMTWNTDSHFDFYTKHHGKTRREIDRLFLLWAQEKGIEKNVTGHSLEKISFKENECVLQYSYRCFGGKTGTLTITTSDYKKQK